MPNYMINEGTVTSVSVTVRQTQRYEFPNPGVACVAHGRTMCVACARNPGDCANDGGGGCSVYEETGMHWDTCPNRIKDSYVYGSRS